MKPGPLANEELHVGKPGVAVAHLCSQTLMDDTWPAQAPGSNPTVVHRGKHIERMLREAATGLAYLTLKEPDPHPLSVARASVALARCDAIYRAGPVTALAGALGRQIKRAKSCADLMMSIEEPRLLDIARMHIPLSELLADWSRAAAEGLPYQPNQAFLAGLAVGGADGDLVIGDLLLDLKAREGDQPLASRGVVPVAWIRSPRHQ